MMKLTKKICIGLMATVLVFSPILLSFNPVQTIQAAKKPAKAKGSLTYIEPSYVYNKFGQRIKRKNSNFNGDFILDPQGYVQTFTYEEDNYDYFATRTINGQKYYKVDNGFYVNEAVVKDVNGKDTKKGKLVLKHKAAVYTKKGKRTTQTLPKNSILKYKDKVKSVTAMPKYFFYENDFGWHLDKLIRYLPIHNIKGQQFYALSNNRYIKAANVDSINGHIVRYNGVASATVLTKTKTETVMSRPTSHTLKKGQKIKVDLTVIPWQDDSFEGYMYRLHDYPDEFVDESVILLKKNLPIKLYTDLVFSYVASKNTGNIQLYDFNGKPINQSIKTGDNDQVKVDGLFYIWLPSENKAELFYHYLNQDDKDVVNSDGTKVVVDDTNNLGKPVARLLYGNNFIKASDVNFTGGIELKPVNTAQDAKEDQQIATIADKKELQDLFNESKVDSIGSHNYDSALTNASAVLRSDKATVAEVKESMWYLKTTKIQLTSMNFPRGD